MKRFLKNSLILLLTFNVFVALNGINLYMHYCDCSHTAKASILIVPEDCGFNDNASVQGIRKGIPSAECCRVITSENEHHQRVSAKKCCFTTVTSLKIENLFFNNFFKININPILFIQLLYDFKDYYILPKPHFKNFIQEIPPPIFGKYLIYFIHQLRLNTPTH